MSYPVRSISLAMASLLGNTSARRSSESQRSLAAVPSSPSLSRSTCPANRLPKLVIIPGLLWLRYSPQLTSPRQPRVEGVADGVAHEVEADHGDEEGDARAEDDPRGLLEIAAAGVDHAAPRGLRRLDAEAEERQRGFGQD